MSRLHSFAIIQHINIIIKLMDHPFPDIDKNKYGDTEILQKPEVSLDYLKAFINYIHPENELIGYSKDYPQVNFNFTYEGRFFRAYSTIKSGHDKDLVIRINYYENDSTKRTYQIAYFVDGGNGRFYVSNPQISEIEAMKSIRLGEIIRKNLIDYSKEYIFSLTNEEVEESGLQVSLIGNVLDVSYIMSLEEETKEFNFRFFIDQFKPLKIILSLEIVSRSYSGDMEELTKLIEELFVSRKA